MTRRSPSRNHTRNSARGTGSVVDVVLDTMVVIVDDVVEVAAAEVVAAEVAVVELATDRYRPPHPTRRMAARMARCKTVLLSRTDMSTMTNRRRRQ